MSEIIDKFNKQFEQFLIEIKKNYPEFTADIDTLYIFPNNNSNYIEQFYENCIDNVQFISEQNEIIFSESNTIISGINFNKIWNDEKIDTEFKNIIWKYIYTLYIFSFEYIQKKDLTTIIKEINNDGDEPVSDDYKMFMTIITKFKDEFINISSNIQNLVEKEISNEDNDSDTSGMEMPDIFGGVIGDLAKSLAEDINPDDLNLDNPAELIKNLMSGGEEGEDNKLGDLIKNITGKIESKINCGELDQDALFSEASGLLGKLQGGGDDDSESSGMNDLFSNIFSQMTTGTDESVPEMKEIHKNSDTEEINDTIQLESTTSDEQLPDIEEMMKMIPQMAGMMEQLPQMAGMMEQLPQLAGIIEQMPEMADMMDNIPQMGDNVRQSEIPNKEEVIHHSDESYNNNIHNHELQQRRERLRKKLEKKKLELKELQN